MALQKFCIYARLTFMLNFHIAKEYLFSRQNIFRTSSVEKDSLCYVNAYKHDPGFERICGTKYFFTTRYTRKVDMPDMFQTYEYRIIGFIENHI